VSGSRDADDILMALRKSVDRGHLRFEDEKLDIDNAEASSVEYPRSYQPLNSQSFRSVTISSDNSGDRGSDDHETPRESREEGPYFGHSASEEARPFYGGLGLSDSESGSVNHSFNSTSTVDYGVILTHHPNISLEAAEGADRTPRFGDSFPAEEEDDTSHYEDGVQNTLGCGISPDANHVFRDHAVSDATEVNSVLDIIMLVRDLHTNQPSSLNVRGVHPLQRGEGSQSDKVQPDPDRVMHVLDRLLTRAEGQNFSLGMAASVILNTQEILEGRNISECYSYPCE
jgi:hypothetical protein